jgi:ribosomal protein L35
MLKFGINLFPKRHSNINLLQKFFLRNFHTFTKFNYFRFFNTSALFNQKFQLEKIPDNSLVKIQSKGMRSAQAKRKLKFPNQNYKMKTKNAAKKRFRIIGGLYDKDFRHWPNNKRHKMLNKTRNNIKRKKTERYVCKADTRHLKRLFPYFKRSKYRN